MLRKLSFAVILSDKWVVQNKVSTLLHYSFWRNRQEHFFILLTSEWFFSKLPHCQCLKINFKLRFSQLLCSGSSQQPSIIGKKINIVSWHYLMSSAFFKSYLACFCHFWEIFNLFVFLIALSNLMLKKWNLAVILSLKHNWVGKRLIFGCYFMINYGETGNYIFCNFWFLNSYRLMSCLKLTGVSYWFPQFVSVTSLASGMYQKRGKCHKHCKTMHT